MFKHTISELKEALVCLQAGQVTLAYPLQPHPAEENFRGKPVVDFERCIGCGACANVCPPRLIQLVDADNYRQISFTLGRCTYCGSCRDVCPAQAVQMSPQFETATPEIDDMNITLQLKLITCRECGNVIATQRMAKRVESALHEAGYSHTENVDMCLSCKRRLGLSSPAWILEVTR
jgi:hydrogenase-4 component H